MMTPNANEKKTIHERVEMKVMARDWIRRYATMLLELGVFG
jgi:hypothetical protein